MPQITSLATGLGVRAENVFIAMARAAFMALDPYKWDPDPEKTKIFILPDDSDEERNRLPQIRVSVGDMSDFEASINPLQVDAIGAPQYRMVDQAYVLFSVYAGNSVEVRDLADYLRNALFQAKANLGKSGIFGMRNMGGAQPRPVEKGATVDKISMATVTAAFYASRTITITEEDGPLWNRVVSKTTDKPTEITGISNDGFDPVAPVYDSHQLRGARTVEVDFDLDVGPFRPGGFSIADDSGDLPLEARRHRTRHNRVQLFLERDIDGTATVTHSGTGLYDLLEEALVETFNFTL